MPLPDLVSDRELLKRILDHYKYRLENFTNEEEIKPLMSAPIRQQLTFGQLKTLVSQTLNELTKDPPSANLNLTQYGDLLRAATNQYVRDLERVKQKSSEELPDTKLKELETEMETVNRYLR